MNLTWELKLFALQMLCKTHLEMSEPNSWYINTHTRRSIAMNGETHPVHGKGKSPQEAIEDDWKLMVDDLPENACIHIYDPKSSEPNRYVRWCGIGWDDIDPAIAGF